MGQMVLRFGFLTLILTLSYELMFDPQSPAIQFPNACPCCGYATLSERGGWEICCVCSWEDDGQDNHNANVVRGGPNGKLSLTRARINFIVDEILCTSRSDLRVKQKPTNSHERHRHFVLDSVASKIFEPELDWETSIAELVSPDEIRAMVNSKDRLK